MSLYPDYATLAEGRDYVRIIDAADVSEDVNIANAITAASRAVDQECSNRTMRRQFGLNGSAVARIYSPRFNPRTLRWVAEIDDLMTVTGLVVKADLDWDGTYETTITDYQLRPFNAAGDTMAWTSILFGITVVSFTALATSARGPSLEGQLQVTANWGWTTVPPTVKAATLVQMDRFLKRRDAPFGVAGSPTTGSELRLLAKVDPDVAVMLAPYGR